MDELPLLPILKDAELLGSDGSLFALLVLLEALGSLLIVFPGHHKLIRLFPGFLYLLQHFSLFVVEHEDSVGEKVRIHVRLPLLARQRENTLVARHRRHAPEDR